MYDEHNAKVDLMVRSKMMESAEGWTCAVCVFSGSIRDGRKNKWSTDSINPLGIPRDPLNLDFLDC